MNQLYIFLILFSILIISILISFSLGYKHGYNEAFDKFGHILDQVRKERDSLKQFLKGRGVK